MPEYIAVKTMGSAPDLSIWTLFWQADWIVQSVMFALLVASVVCWAIAFSKIISLCSAKNSASQFEEVFWSGTSLESLFDRLNGREQDPLSGTFVAGMREWKRSSSKGPAVTEKSKEVLQHRIERVMHVHASREMDSLEKNMGFLASVGSTAPFVGLFGTVWGIMNSFQGIAASQSTNLAVVAPGIAEALFATALGLVAAIPAVLAYNKLTSDIGRYGARLEEFVDEFTALISRQLDEK